MKVFLATLKPSCFLVSGLQKLEEGLAECGFEMDITSSASIQASLLRLEAQCEDEDVFLVNTKGSSRYLSEFLFSRPPKI